MRAIVFSSLTLLALCACNRESTNSPTAEAANAPVATAESDPFVGRYRLAGTEGSDKGEVVITRGEGTYTVMVDVGAPGCGGQAKGPARRAGESLLLTAGIDGTALRCEVELRPEGKTLIVEEGAGCANFHGAKCDLNGTATRK